jgi:hypothetical protein
MIASCICDEWNYKHILCNENPEYLLHDGRVKNRIQRRFRSDFEQASASLESGSISSLTILSSKWLPYIMLRITQLNGFQCIIQATRPIMFTLVQKRLTTPDSRSAAHRTVSEAVVAIVRTCVETASTSLKILQLLHDQCLIGQQVSICLPT